MTSESREDQIFVAALLVFALCGCLSWVASGVGLAVLRWVGAVAGLVSLGAVGVDWLRRRER